jgi:xanthine dehydrogenase large subunit
VREALRQAVGAFGPAGHSVELGSPATPEAIYWAIEAARVGWGREHQVPSAGSMAGV